MRTRKMWKLRDKLILLRGRQVRNHKRRSEVDALLRVLTTKIIQRELRYG